LGKASDAALKRRMDLGAGAFATRSRKRTILDCVFACRWQQSCLCGDQGLRYVADFRAALGQAAACQCL